MSSIVKTEPGSKPIHDPNRESDGLTGAIMAATARLLDEVSP